MGYDGRQYGSEGSNTHRRRMRGGQQRNGRTISRQNSGTSGRGSGRDAGQGTFTGSAGSAGAIVPWDAGAVVPREYNGSGAGASGSDRVDVQVYSHEVVESDAWSEGRRSTGQDLLSEATEYLEARDIAGATEVLLKLTKTEHTRSARNDPKMQDVLSRMYGQLLSNDSNLWPRDLSNLAFTLGKLQLTDPIVVELLKRIAEITQYQADRFSPHDMAGIVWGFASLGVRNEALMSVIAAEIVNKISEFDQRQLSNAAWAFAKCGLWNEQLVNAIAEESLSKISTFTAQSLSHISWAMAQWATRKDDLMAAITTEVRKKTGEFQPAPLAMTAWSCASLQIKDVHLMSTISAKAISKIKAFKTQDVAHLAWAFANLRMQDQQLFNVMAEEVQQNIKGSLPSELANIAWAFSKNNFAHEPLMNLIANEAVSQLRIFKAAEIAMLSWAFAVAGLPRKQLMSEVGAQVSKRIERFSGPQLSHITWAFGALSLRHSEFLQTLSAHVHLTLSAFRPQALANIAWAFAMLTFRDDDLLRAMAPEIARDASELRPLALARCAWAYRVLAVRNTELMAAITVEALHKVQEFPTKALAKLVDSVYISPPAREHVLLEEALGARLAHLSSFFKDAWRPGGQALSMSTENYSASLMDFGLLDCGIVGTPMLLSQLAIELPSLAFIRRCRAREWAKCQQDRDFRTNREFTVAQVAVSALDRPLHDWVIRYSDGAEDREPTRGHWLLQVDLPGSTGGSDPTYLVLAEICDRLFGLGVDLNSVDACRAVSGTVQLLATVLPDVSTVGVMHQFAMWFPHVTLEFAEQVGVATEP